MSTADIQLSVVFGGQYSFEKLQSDYEQTDTLARDYIKNKPDLVNFEAETITAETVIFDENPTGVIGARKLQYSPDEKTLEFGLADGGKLQIGKEMFEEYTNIDTVALTNGMIVSTAAIPGNRKGIKRTDFTNLTSIRSIVGMVTVSSIATNQAGRVTTKGIINDLNTNGWAEGSQLWGNPAVLGGWSGNKPAKPQYAVQIGQVVVASATVGSVELNVAKDVKFSDLADVNGSTSAIDNTDTIPKRDADGIIREITVADIKANFKTDTDALYEPLLGFTPENVANKGQANGYASLGADGLVPSNQLPSFVDDVLEFANLAAFPVTGEQGKIYVALDTNKTYRWSGSAYIYITSGAVDSVAGKTGVVTLVKGDVGLGNVDNTSDSNKPVSTLQAAAIATKVGLTGNETVAGIKTFSSSPIVPNPTTSGQALNKGTADGAYVALTGAQNIAGVKTFTDSPIVPTPVNNTDAANKAYVQSVITVGNDTYQENKLVTDARVASLENTLNSANINQETTATVSGVDTIALPKTAANTGMQVQMFGQSAQNLVVNGDFRVDSNSDGLADNWGKRPGSIATIINGKQRITAGTDNRVQLEQVSINIISSHKYYLKFFTSTNYSGSSPISVFSSDTSNNYYSSTQRNGTLTSVFTAIENKSGFFIRIYDLLMTSDIYFELDDIVLINLTATFGAGNEPTKEQCDVLFANYFEGTDNVLGTGRVRSVGKNLFDKNDVTFNKFIRSSDGTIQDSTIANLSNYIKVQPSTVYTFSGRTGSVTTAFYDTNKSIISFSAGQNVSITSPANAAFVRFHILHTDMNTAQMERNTVASSYDPFRKSSLYLTTPALRSNGLIKDEIRKGTNGYELVKRVGVGTLGAELITNAADREFTSDTGFWTKGASVTINEGGSGVAKIANTSDSLYRNNFAIAGKWYRLEFTLLTGSVGVGIGCFAIDYFSTGTKILYWKAASNGTLLFQSRSTNTTIDNVSYKELTASEAISATSTFTELGGNVHFTLATPVITPIAHAGLLNSNSNGTAYFEPIIADAGVYSTNLAVQLTDYPISSFESIRKYANGTYTELNTATAVIASGGLSFTHPDLVSGDLVMFTYAYNRESIGRSMTLTHFDSRFVVKDTANANVYRITPTITNGVLTWTLTLV